MENKAIDVFTHVNIIEIKSAYEIISVCHGRLLDVPSDYGNL